MLLIALVALCGCERTSTSDSSVKWTSRLVMPVGDLVVRCDQSTSGRCHVRIDDRGQERTASLAVGASQRTAGISPDARICVVAATDAACDWRAVKPADAP